MANLFTGQAMGEAQYTIYPEKSVIQVKAEYSTTHRHKAGAPCVRISVNLTGMRLQDQGLGLTFRGLVDGLPFAMYSMSDNGRSVFEWTDDIIFELELDGLKCPLVAYAAAIDQEIALSKVLAGLKLSVREALLNSPGASAGFDIDVFNKQSTLETEIESLTALLDVKQKALHAILEDARAARNKLLETEVPAVTGLMRQVQDLRVQVGMC